MTLPANQSKITREPPKPGEIEPKPQRRQPIPNSRVGCAPQSIEPNPLTDDADDVAGRVGGNHLARRGVIRLREREICRLRERGAFGTRLDDERGEEHWRTRRTAAAMRDWGDWGGEGRWLMREGRRVRLGLYRRAAREGSGPARRSVLESLVARRRRRRVGVLILSGRGCG